MKLAGEEEKMPPELDAWKQFIIACPIGGALVGVFWMFVKHLQWKEQNQNLSNERMACAIEKLAAAFDKNSEATIRICLKGGGS
jgi:hypothetical protein